jgi:hypothetical protein
MSSEERVVSRSRVCGVRNIGETADGLNMWDDCDTSVRSHKVASPKEHEDLRNPMLDAWQ